MRSGTESLALADFVTEPYSSSVQPCCAPILVRTMLARQMSRSTMWRRCTVISCFVKYLPQGDDALRCEWRTCC